MSTRIVPTTIVQLEGTFTDAGAPYDPPVVWLCLRPRNGDVIRFRYGVAPELVRESTGVFRFQFRAADYPSSKIFGAWEWFYYATGTLSGDVYLEPQSLVVCRAGFG